MGLPLRTGQQENGLLGNAFNILLCFILSGSAYPGYTKNNVHPKTHTISLGSGEWPPYEGFKLPEYGLSNYWVRKAFDSQGISIDFHFLPWKKSMSFANDDRLNGTLVWTKTAQREKDFYFSSPVLNQKTVFFHSRHKNLDWSSLTDLKGLRIGITKGYVYHPQLDQLIKDDLSDKNNSRKKFFGIINENPGDEMSLRQLASGKIDIWPVEVPVAKSLIKKLLTKKESELITWNPKPIKENTYHLILNKRNQRNAEFMESFEKGFKSVKDRVGEEIITEPCSASDRSKLSEVEKNLYKELCP